MLEKNITLESVVVVKIVLFLNNCKWVSVIFISVASFICLHNKLLVIVVYRLLCSSKIWVLIRKILGEYLLAALKFLPPALVKLYRARLSSLVELEFLKLTFLWLSESIQNYLCLTLTKPYLNGIVMIHHFFFCLLFFKYHILFCLLFFKYHIS